MTVTLSFSSFHIDFPSVLFIWSCCEQMFLMKAFCTNNISISHFSNRKYHYNTNYIFFKQEVNEVFYFILNIYYFILCTVALCSPSRKILLQDLFACTKFNSCVFRKQMEQRFPASEIISVEFMNGFTGQLVFHSSFQGRKFIFAGNVPFTPLLHSELRS